MNLEKNYLKIKDSLPKDVALIAVSKTYPVEKIFEVYHLGQKDFGENKVQEILAKKDQLPIDINWHLIGHLQTNKVKSILPFVYLIQSVDRLKLIRKIQTEAEALHKKVSILLQVKIAKEETKYGLNKEELDSLLELYEKEEFPNIEIKGLMGMASFTNSQDILQQEFEYLYMLYNQRKSQFNFSILSMGMSSDYELAIECGSNMVRVGSAIFGERNLYI